MFRWTIKIWYNVNEQEMMMLDASEYNHVGLDGT